MKLFANKLIRQLLLKSIACCLFFTMLSLGLLYFEIIPSFIILPLCTLLSGVFILCFCIQYFRKQNTIMENAVSQITEYISGNPRARIECDEEGEVYRLFHEINILVSVLNAHIEQESHSRQFLKTMISDISHQLKTPLAALNIYNGILQGETEDLPELQEFVSLSEKELERMETLVQNLLKITKLDAGSVVMEKRNENLADILTETELRFACRAEQEGKKLLLSGEDNVFLSCDRDWLSEAIDNIVKNALDHTQNGDHIKIQWQDSAASIQLRISDNGSGIHPEDLPHIFKRFYQSRFSRDKQGIGLGLPLAKMIVEAHDGTIEVESELGKGTLFVISFLKIPTKL